MHPLIAALVSICMSVAAQFALKRGMASQPAGPLEIATNPYVLLGLALYGLGAVVWLAVLSKWDVSKAYPLVGLGFALTVLVGALSGEAVTLQRVAGVLAICSGVWLVARS